MEDWNARKAKLKEKFSTLIEASNAKLENKHEQVIGTLEKRLATTRAAVLKLLSEL